LIFPATAISKPNFSIKKSWKMTRKNTFRIFITSFTVQFVSAILAVVIMSACVIIAIKVSSPVLFYVMALIIKVVCLLMMMLGAIVNSALYDFFMYHRGSLVTIPKDITDLAVANKSEIGSSFVPLMDAKEDKIDKSDKEYAEEIEDKQADKE